MKKVLATVVTVCVVFGAAAAFAQGAGRHVNQQQTNHPKLEWQDKAVDANSPAREHRNQQAMNHPEFNGKPPFAGKVPGSGSCPGFGFEGGRHCRGGFRGMNFTPDMPQEIREKAAELAKLRVDLEEAISSDPINKAKALETHAKMQKLEQEIGAWRFAQKLERMEEFRKQMKLNREVPPAPVKEEAKDAPTK